LSRKLQQFFIIKTNTKRLKKSNYEINFNDINEARRNGEVVSIGESQLIRSLFRLQGKIEEDLMPITEKVLSLSKNRKQKAYNASELDSILFIPEIISVVVDKKKDYEYIAQHGFIVNGKKYVRLLCGAGHSRRNNSIFIEEQFANPLKKVLNNGRNENIPIAPSKFNAYFALCSSATYQVSSPEFAVIRDLEIVKQNCLVNVVEENDTSINPYLDDDVVERQMDIAFNLFDGMGLISPSKAIEWADELGLDYIPSTFIIRNNFMKGMVAVFDFHAFAEEFEKKYFNDVWGKKTDIRNVDMVLTESQLKMWNAFENHAQYVDNLRTNGLHWGVSRYAPKYDSDYIYTNYQFLQVEDFSEDDMKKICQPTIDFFGQAIGYDADITKLYLLGKVANQPFDESLNILEKISDPITKTLLLRSDFIDDPYIRAHIISSLNKKIRDSYIGNLLLDGNYQTIISDPYAFCEHIFDMPANGLLQINQHYANYWLKKNVVKVAALRAPLTWRSEINILNLIANEKTQKWYKYIKTGIIYNVHGFDNMLQADSDYDGDIIMTTNNEQVINNAYRGLPVTYTKNKTPKEIIDENTLYEYDIKAFDTRIGFITNCSTTLYAMLSQYDKSSKEYSEIIKRLKICRKEQGNQIDKAKGLIVKSFPKHWTNWTKVTSANESFSDAIKFNNSILIDKRPYFMRYLYTNYNKDYTQHIANFDKYCLAMFGKEFKDINEHDEGYSDIIEKYERYSPLLDTRCTMNDICHHMEKTVKEIKLSFPLEIHENLLLFMKDKTIPFDSAKYKQMEALFRRYRSERSRFNKIAAREGQASSGEGRFRTIEQYNKFIRFEAYKISQNFAELTNLAVSICYELHPSDSKSFVWSVFGDGIVENIKNNCIMNGKTTLDMLFFDEDGGADTTYYLGKSYKTYKMPINPTIYDGYEMLDEWE
jgi:hypothetical protein